MKAVRYVSEEELFILVERGIINAETCPFAVIAPDEDLKDTEPRPQTCTVMFFEDVQEFYPYDSEGYVKLSVDVPDECIIGKHVGKYDEWSEDYDGNHYIFATYHMSEISTYEFKWEWVIGVRVTCGSDWATFYMHPQFCGDGWMDFRGMEKADVKRVLKENPGFEEWRAMNFSHKVSSFAWDHEQEVAHVWQAIKHMVTIFR